MAGLSAHGATFSFHSFNAAIVGLSVNTPTAEIVDMTPVGAPASQILMVPTGAVSGGEVSVDYIRLTDTVDPQSLVSKCAALQFSSAGFSLSRRAILQSATTEVRAGDIVKGTLRFVLTDYQGE